ncbi:hypothetical protein DUNSADRAFT_13855 [Dunaliella salina]|uniref:Uncharacterized protein n=1 Tax=Dunaliella salina TaxID=3046 RepID=A0ABQ7H2Y3_DUNSA|nr:hypothetical protein DUNSADRAFT_13855 [Dunaliella salina]|eukprot:KAF5841210.1 hypothetical protein DUNSADRAFT_13855 [Dunaliella salina]
MQHAALGVVALVNRIRRELECILQNGPLTSSHTLVLQAKELQASVDALLSLSEQTQWHLAGGSLHGEQSQQMVPLYAACWQHVIDTQLLKLTAVVLERHRVPHVALGKAGDDKTVPEAIQVGPFHESLLRACALFIAGVRSEAAPPHLHRPVLEHLLVHSGFILLVADSLKALVQCAANHPRLLAEAEGGQQHQQEAAAFLPSSRQKGGKFTTTPQRYGAAAPQQQLRQTSGAARSSLRSHPSSACLAPMCSTPAVASYNSSPDTSRCAAAASVPDASFVAYARSAAHEVSLAAQEHPRHQHHHQPHSRAHCPLTGCSMHQQAPFPDLHTLGPAAEAGRASGWLCTSLGTDAHPELFLKRGPHGRITAGLWQDGQGSDTGLLQQQQHQSSSSQGLLLEQPTLQSKGHISRRGAQCVLGILRDLNGIAGLEAATATDHASKEQLRVSERETKEALSRLLGIWTQPAFADVGGLMRGSVTVHEQRGLQAGAQIGAGIDTGRGSVADALVRMRSKSLAGGRDGVLGSASIALEELGASMLDVRAVLAGLLSEMKLLGQLVDLHRNAELAGCTKEDNLPYLEVITAIVASFNSPDLATSHSKHRNASTYTDPRLFSAVLEPAVVELSMEELCIVATSTFQSIEGFSDVPVARLPHELQGRLHLLHKLVASLVILSAAPLPPSTRTPLMPCSTTLSPSLNSMQRQPGTPTASPATVRNSDTSMKPISSAHFPPRPSSAGTSPYPFSPFRHIPTPPAALTPPHRPPSHSLPTPLVERPLAHASACSHPDSAPMLANSQKGAALQRTHSHATALGLTFSQGSPMANSSASKRSQLLESAHPDALPVMDAGLQGLQGGDGVGLQEEMYRGGSPTKEAVSLPDVVSALVLSCRIFAGFASCDIHFFNKATSTLMHTLKAVTKRLAAEGLDEHVEGIAVGLSQVLCSMTRAMGAAAQAAVHEEAHDQARQQEDLLEWERQRAKETWKAGGAQRGLFTLKPNQVLWSYVGKPHGWGAGANKGLGDTPLPRDPLTNHAWRLSNEGSLRSPMSSFNVRPSSAASSTSDRSQTTAGQSVSRPSSATSWASHRSPRDGSTAAASATPRLERLSEVDQDETLPEEQAESNGAANARGLDALWDALGLVMAVTCV